MSQSIKSRRSFLIKPYYDWMVASHFTPYVSVDVSVPGTQVPEKFVQNGQIILNIKPEAVRDFNIDHKAISFSATFAGIEEVIYIPLPAVRAIYTKEQQDGIVFDEQDDEAEMGSSGSSKPVLRILD